MRFITLIIFISLCSLEATIAQCKYNPTGRDIITHEYFTLDYVEEHEQAAWVCYKLTREMSIGTVERTDDFKIDPKVRTGSSALEDYRGSGYDRGHLAPAADFSFSETAMRQSFFMSNMSPQNPSFNRGIWRKLEALVRDWSLMYDELHIVTGPLFINSSEKIGPNGVTIPSHYYKVILHERDGAFKSIAFLLENEKSNADLVQFATSIDLVESQSGIDFFFQLPDEIENEIESEISLDDWQWEPVATPAVKETRDKGPEARNDAERLEESVRCQGTTSKGTRCKNQTKNASGYCHVHDG